MAATLRIKRRTSGTSNGGVPTTSQCVNAELAFNEVNGTLYYGKGGNETASSSVVAVAGEKYTLIDGVTAGTIAASKAVTVNSSREAYGNLNFGFSGSYGAAELPNVESGAVRNFYGKTNIRVGGFENSEEFTLTNSYAPGNKVRFSLDENTAYAEEDTGSATWHIASDATSSGQFNLYWPNQTGRLATLADVSNILAEFAGYTSSLKQPVSAATTANITLSGPQTIDGTEVTPGNRVLVKNQTTATENGIYNVASGAWSRAADTDTGAELLGASVFVLAGTVNSNKTFVNTNSGSITLGSTNVTFADQTSAVAITAGNGLTKTGTTIDVGTASASRIVVNADNIDLATVGTAGTYRSVTTDAYGRVTAGSNPTTFAGYGISDTSANLAAAITDETGSGSLVFATSPTLVTPNIGTPSAGTLTNCTGLPVSSGISGLGTGVATFLATPSSANLAAVLTDETGSSSVVFSNSPTLVTPNIGVATATSVNKVAITAPATSATLTIADGKTLTVSNTLTFTGTDASSVAFGTGGTVLYTTSKLSALAATTSSELAGVISDETGSGSLVFATSPTLVTPVLGTPTSGTLTNCTGLPVSSGISGLGTGVATFLATPSSANLAAALTDETGSNSVVFSTSPNFTTSVTTNSASFDVFNTNATTVNAFGAATTVSIGASNGTVTINGNLQVNGTTTTVNSTTVTVDDPIFTLGGDTAPTSDDNKDRGIEFRYFDTQARVGFFGWDDSAAAFTVLSAATNSSEVFSGTLAPIVVGTVNKVTLTQPATGSTLTIADGKTLTASNTLTFTGTDSSSVAFGAGGTVVYTTNKLSAFAATTSSELAGVISDETGSGSLVFATSPTLTTPNIGVATATSVNKVAITAPATSATLTIADGKTLTASNTLTFTGTDSSSVAFGAGGTVLYTTSKLSAHAATTSSELAGVISDETGSGSLVFGTSPAFTTSVTTGSTTFAVFNTTATTVNAFGAATALTMGAATGTTTVNNDLQLGSGKTLKLPGSTSGTLTVAGPATAGTNTITFPAETGTVVTTASICTALDNANCTIDGGTF